LGQTGNIGAIKTATDTINWAQVTGIVTTAGPDQSWADGYDQLVGGLGDQDGDGYH
jgi:hypothetical protein